MAKTFAIICFFTIGLALYYPAAHAGLIGDFTGWILEYKMQGIKGVLHLFGDKGLHPLYHIAFYALYKIFGVNQFCWFLTFLLLHVFNTFLSFLFFSKLFQNSGIKRGHAIAFFGALFFLLSPYQTEPVIWKATIHYLTATSAILGALIFSLNYMKAGKTSSLIAVHLLFIFSLLSLEIGLSLPFILLALILLGANTIFGRISQWDFFSRVCVPQFLLIPIYFLLSRILLGHWIGHYGAKTHLNITDVLLAGSLTRYFLKYAAFLQFANYPLRSGIYDKLTTPVIGHLLFAGYLIGGLAMLYRKKKSAAPPRQILLLLFALSILGMMTTFNLYFNYLTNIENDRFGYLGSVFILMIVSYIVFKFNSILRCFLLGAFLFLSAWFLSYNIRSWKNNAVISRNLVRSFGKTDAKKIFILNLPDNYRGSYMFRNFTDSSMFAANLYVTTGINRLDKIKDVLYYNMNNLGDSVIISRVSAHSLRVTFAQWGCWWWKRGIGANNFEDRDFSVKIDEWSHSYLITFKKDLKGPVILYQAGTTLRRFDD